MQVKQQKRISWLWLFVPQLVLLGFVALLFDKVSLQVFQWIFVFALIVFPVLGYVLLLLLRPDIRRVWGDAIFDTWTGIGELLRLLTFRNFLKFMAELGTDESVPKTKEQWISIALLPWRIVSHIIGTIRRLDWFPKSKSDWFAFLLLPFKTYVFLGFPMLWLCISFFRWQGVWLGGPARWDVRNLNSSVEFGYAASLAFLLAGALIQSLFCKQGSATRTIWVTVLGTVLIMLF